MPDRLAGQHPAHFSFPFPHTWSWHECTVIHGAAAWSFAWVWCAVLFLPETATSCLCAHTWLTLMDECRADKTATAVAVFCMPVPTGYLPSHALDLSNLVVHYSHGPGCGNAPRP